MPFFFAGIAVEDPTVSRTPDIFPVFFFLVLSRVIAVQRMSRLTPRLVLRGETLTIPWSLM